MGLRSASAGVLCLLIVACGEGRTRAGGEGGSTGGADGGAEPSGPSAGTSTGDPDQPDPEPGTTTAEDTGGDEPPPAPTSPKANLQFKGPRRLEADLAAVLELDPAEVCVEVGGGSCTGDVHRVALGGVAPYDLGIYAPASLGVTAPVAVDRVVLRACQARVDRDLAAPTPALFDVPLTGPGVSDIEAPQVDTFIDRLYTRALLRHSTAEETDALKGLYGPVVESGDRRPGRSWAIGTCFAVLTTAEFLFY